MILITLWREWPRSEQTSWGSLLTAAETVCAPTHSRALQGPRRAAILGMQPRTHRPSALQAEAQMPTQFTSDLRLTGPGHKPGGRRKAFYILFHFQKNQVSLFPWLKKKKNPTSSWVAQGFPLPFPSSFNPLSLFLLYSFLSLPVLLVSYLSLTSHFSRLNRYWCSKFKGTSSF